MRLSLRAVHGLMLAGALAPFLPTASSILLAWGFPAAGLLLARGIPEARAAASRALVVLAALVALALVGIGFTLGHTGLGSASLAWDDYFVAAMLVSVWLPSGVFVASTADRWPARLATAGVVAMVGWAALYTSILLGESGAAGFAAPLKGEGHIVLGGAGALVVTLVLAWRVAQPMRAPAPAFA